jgi:hypothetical protein
VSCEGSFDLEWVILWKITPFSMISGASLHVLQKAATKYCRRQIGFTADGMLSPACEQRHSATTKRL